MMHHTGVPSGPDELPQFDPSPHWGERAVPAASPTFTPAAPEAYEEVLARLARFVGDVDELRGTQRPGNRNLKGLDSLYLGRSGVFYLLQPHTHDIIAGTVMRKIHPEVPPSGDHKSKGGGWTHHDLSRASGIQRIQIYSGGMGVAVNMDNPPNRAQLDVVREAHARTPRARFVAEIDLGGRTLVTLGTFDELARFVSHWDPHDPDKMLEWWSELGDLWGSPADGAPSP